MDTQGPARSRADALIGGSTPVVVIADVAYDSDVSRTSLRAKRKTAY